MIGLIFKHFKGIFWGAATFATLYGGAVLINDRLQNVQKYEVVVEEDAEEAKRQKVFLVTGANSGIGKQLTSELALKKTNKVYMLCRDMTKCESARTQIVKQTGNKYILTLEYLINV